MTISLAVLIPSIILLASTIGCYFSLKGKIEACQKDTNEIKERLGNGEPGIFVKRSELTMRVDQAERDHEQFDMDIREHELRLQQLERK